MKKFIALCALALTVAGCASQRLNDGLPHLVGKKVEYAIGYLGYPQSEQTVAGKKIYTWGHSNTFTTLQTVRTPFSGSAYGLGGGTYYSGHTTSVVPQTHNYQCSIRLIANSNDIIERWEWNGNEGGCSRYSDAAKRMAETEDLWQRAAEDRKAAEESQ